MLLAVAASADEGLDGVEPPVTGPWADTNAFLFEDTLETYGALIEAPGYATLYRTDAASSMQYLSPETKELAPSAGTLCIITTGDAGELALQLYMLGVSGEESAVTVTMDGSATFEVAAP